MGLLLVVSCCWLSLVVGCLLLLVVSCCWLFLVGWLVGCGWSVVVGWLWLVGCGWLVVVGWLWLVGCFWCSLLLLFAGESYPEGGDRVGKCKSERFRYFLECFLVFQGGVWSVDGGRMPLPTCPKRCRDPASPV